MSTRVRVLVITCAFLATLVLVPTLPCTPSIGAEAAEPLLTWQQSAYSGFGAGANSPAAMPLAQYKGKLYAGVANQAGAQVWVKNEHKWEKVIDGGFGSADNAAIVRMQVYNDHLYAGTANMKGCGLWRYDGITWIDALASPGPGPGFGNANNLAVTAMEVYDGELYVGLTNYLIGFSPGTDGVQIWKSNGAAWSPVDCGAFASSPNNAGVTSFEAYNGALYAATVRFNLSWSLADWDHVNVYINSAGFELFSTTGAGWSKVAADGITSTGNIAATSMIEYDGQLYIGTANGSAVAVVQISTQQIADISFNSQGLYIYSYDGGKLTEVVKNGFGSSNDMAAVCMEKASVSGSEYLLVGTIDPKAQGKLQAFNGASWQAAAAPGLGNTDNKGIVSLAAVQESGTTSIYAGTLNSTGGCEVWLASEPGIPGPPTYYFAEGSCRPGVDTYFCIQNAGGDAADVTIHYMKGDGSRQTQDEIPVPPKSRVTVSVLDALYGSRRANDDAHDFSAVVVCYGPKVFCERPMYFNYKGWTGGHDTKGVPDVPQYDWYFAEGSCRPGVDTYFCIQNPGEIDAAVTITYMKGDDGTASEDLTVAPHSRRTVAAKNKLGERNDDAHDFSAVVRCEEGPPIVVERPMYFNYNGWTGGHNVIGEGFPKRTWCFAEGSCRPGVDTYFCIQNPREIAADVTITYMKGNGSTVSEDVTVPPHSRRTAAAKNKLGVGNDEAHDFSAVVECKEGQSIIVERPMYFNYNGWNGGHNVMGFSGSPFRFWYFAEGSCRPGVDTYFCIQNPGDTPAAVTITYMKGNGSTASETVPVPPHSRRTVAAKNKLGVGNDDAHDFCAVVACEEGQSIIVERPMYFNYNGWNGGHNVMGHPRPL